MSAVSPIAAAAPAELLPRFAARFIDALLLGAFEFVLGKAAAPPARASTTS